MVAAAGFGLAAGTDGEKFPARRLPPGKIMIMKTIDFQNNQSHSDFLWAHIQMF